MDLAGWNERYRTEDAVGEPTPLLAETASRLRPGKVLDLACGSGRNALWLARHGWSVTGVDGAAEAIAMLRRKAAAENLVIATHIADLERDEYPIEQAHGI